MRRVGVLLSMAESDPQAKTRIRLFEQGLQELGWTVDSSVKVDYRFAAGDAGRAAVYAAELVNLAPDALLAGAPPLLRALGERTRVIPIVFVGVADPVSTGFVKSLAKPGGNVTGFTNFEFPIAGKWLELLKQIAPRIRRVAVIHNPTNPTAAGYLRVIDEAAPSFGVQRELVAAQGAAEMERGIVGAARASSDGLIVLPEISTTTHRELIVTLAARHRLPAIYPFRFFATSGGLISYGPGVEGFRQAGIYIGRILKGERPADLPVEASKKFDLVINLNTAKALGLTVPDKLLAISDEVIE
jgi:putative ABC transport system substrate-binding protein